MYILASASPRRKELLSKITDNFKVVVSNTDETVPCGMAAENVPEYLAFKKAEAVAVLNPLDTVIGADTAVFLNGKMLGKPKDESDAFNILKSLSGNTHTVITGCAIIKGNKKITFSQKTKVTFYPISDSDINRYIKSGEPMDKAGAYGIQGKGALFVKEISGDYFNVVGLPVSRLAIELKKI